MWAMFFDWQTTDSLKQAEIEVIESNNNQVRIWFPEIVFSA